ncbi:Phenoxybenzoate dioxygenase subunit beta [compost metagenome]
MLEAYKAAAAKIPSERVHYESFAPMQEANTAGGYDVSLARTGKTLMIQEGQTLLDALCEAGVEVMNSCREGICGACEVRVLAGIPDHRDSILSHAEREANKTMFVCCSGSKSPNLILDL